MASITGSLRKGRRRATTFLASLTLLLGGAAAFVTTASPAGASGSSNLLAVVAGGGGDTPSSSPDGATNVMLEAPSGVAVDASGDLFIADMPASLVYEVSGGQLTVVAGGGVNDPSTTPQTPTSVAMGSPTGLALDSSGDLFIADAETGEVYKLSATTHKLFVVAGGGTNPASTTPTAGADVELGAPSGLAITPSGTLLIADTAALDTGPSSSAGELDAWDPATGLLSVIAGGGASPVTTTGAEPLTVNLSEPTGVVADSAGNIYISDTYGHVVDELSASSGLIAVVAGGGDETPSSSGQPATQVNLGTPVGLTLTKTGALDIAGNGYYGDTPAVYQLSGGSLSAIAGEGSGDPSTTPAPANTLALSGPLGIAADADGAVYVADNSAGLVYEMGTAPSVARISPTQGSALGGTTVQVTGGDFAGATAVDFGTKPATSFSCALTTCTAVSPPGSVGAVSVSVVTGLGKSASSNASQFTYDKVPTTTKLTLSSPSTTYGTEQLEKLSVAVSSSAKNLTPTGTVTIPGTGCSIKLTNGKGTCSLSATSLSAGQSHLVANYSGDANFVSSTSSSVTLTVAKATTTTSLKLSKPTVVFGQENQEVFTITVSRHGSTPPTGSVSLTGASCSRTLQAGKATCTIAAKALAVGPHKISATYAGTGDFERSTSASVSITIEKS